MIVFENAALDGWRNSIVRAIVKRVRATVQRFLGPSRPATAPVNPYSTKDIIPDRSERPRAALLQVLKDPVAARRKGYAWGVVQGAELAARLGVDCISVLEFGVAGGNGLVALERIAGLAADSYDIVIEVYGFDTGEGLPVPVDYRDFPHIFAGGTYVMDVDAVRTRLSHARLVLGPLERTVGQFLASQPAPVAFAAIDVDLYTSTVHALKVLEADADFLLPRIACYFDDVLGVTSCDWAGERLAIAEFNAAHAMRKISFIHGLRHSVPPAFRDHSWVDKMFMAHLFDHPRYGQR
jgi:hypothetical protein